VSVAVEIILFSISFCRDYVAISHQDQRNRYKDEFNKEYEEYIHLFKYIDGVTKKWVDLARRLDLAGQGTPDHTVSFLPITCYSFFL